jgi:NADH:ubiquinone oxidoreductase subunit F (NADH-binding)
MTPTRLLDGAPLAAGPEGLAAHRARLGPLPEPEDARQMIPVLEGSGLLGRGGAGFPVGRKWRSVAERAGGHAVVLANGAEGEPLSAKDRTLMAARPHLVLDGALLAAAAVGADRVLVYVGQEHRAAVSALRRAVAERAAALDRPVSVVEAPTGYVSGEETAAVRYVDQGVALPAATPPRPFERGVGGRPTLVQNVESLAAAALIARQGGRPDSALVTVSGPLAAPGVREVELGASVGEAAAAAGGLQGPAQAVLLGGYFGGWTAIEEAWRLPLDPAGPRERGAAFGCGVVAFLPAEVCGVRATAEIAASMAAASAAQCGPCVFGLRAIADAAGRLASGAAAPDDLERLERWSRQVAGRGACRHPDGAAGFVQSALRVFGAEFRAHQYHRRCAHQPLRRAA